MAPDLPVLHDGTDRGGVAVPITAIGRAARGESDGARA
jgi:hypothetical protein